jgi:ubiquinol-cytochrome c reductase cytochrome c subunit
MQRWLMAVALLTLGVATFAQQAQRKPSAAHGREVYMKLACYTCHGTVGQGGAGAILAPNTIPFEAFQTWVRNGTPGWSVERGMPAWSRSVISDDDLADVREYLATLPAPKAAKDIALLRD